MKRKVLSKLVRSTDLERLRLMLSRPNIFEVLKITRSEIRHSNFLAWLLDPSQSHNLGDTILKWFLKDVFQDEKVSWVDEFQVDNLKTDDVVVHREFENIDLLVESPDWVLIIENKFYSLEHSNQLARYRKVADASFPNKKKAFVFLTPYRDSPENENDKRVYVDFDYGSIVTLLDQALNIYGNTLSKRVADYISDYIDILKRHVMSDDDAAQLAKTIYKNHRDALDFIFEHKPDRLAEVDDLVEQMVRKRGYVLGSTNKGFTRFLTPELKGLIPHESSKGWTNRESFLYELGYRGRKVYFKTVVSPGDTSLRERLVKALEKIDGARKTSSELWSSVHTASFNLNLTSDKYLEDEKLITAINKVLDEIEPIIRATSHELVSEMKK